MNKDSKPYWLLVIPIIALVALFAGWIRLDIVSPNIMRYIIGALIVVAVVINGMFYWNMSLKKRVDQKTKELTAALRALEQSNKKVNGIINSIPDMVFLLDRNGVYLDYLSHVNEKDLYLKPELFIGKSLKDTMPESIAEKAMEKIRVLFEIKQIQILNYELMINGSLGFYESRFVMIDEDMVMCIIRDISEKKKNEDLLYSLSIHDMPTGLYNRNYFEEKIKSLTGDELRDIGIVICDIDGLKLVNDTLGHAEGDNYLRTVADILRENFPADSIVSRIGGDEFAVISMNISQSEIQNIKRKISKIIDLHNKEGRVVPISLSVGYAIKGEKHKSISEVFKEADDFMYREKLHHRQSIRSNNIDLLNKMLLSKTFKSAMKMEEMISYMTQLAVKEGIMDEQLKDLRLFVLFHDVGNIGISESLLLKKSALTKDEWLEMRRHTEIGYRIAESSSDLKHISEWIFKHQERWDGTGYPFGLKGYDIPIQCRILALVDSYNAMISDRPYRKALSKEQAIEELKKEAGKQFEPALTDAFLELLKEKEESID